MADLTDRQCTEQLLLLEMLISIIVDGASNRLEAATVEAATLLHLAIVETVAPFPVERRLKLHARSQKLNRRIGGAHRVLGQPVAAFGLAVYVLLRWVTDVDYLVIHEGSDLERALDALLPALEPAASIESLVRARRAAAAMLADMQAENLFLGVVEAADA